MIGLAICPQRHVWSPTASDGKDDTLKCPVCGERGVVAADSPTGADVNEATLLAAGAPPVVFDVTMSYPPGSADPAPALDDDLPNIPGYDLVRELGRGGMGVVYLARHRGLKRLVALKMIRAGGRVDAELRARFRREAEAVAKLQHPGIVQIHDVGEHDGCPFLALEYVDGTDLARKVAGAPITPHLAAQVVESLARIMHHAHEMGIVHRDLTPRNVLLAHGTSGHSIRLGEAAERSELKITDFGLAKDLEDDCSRTQTGVIMGTPAYMAPEQAQGRTDQIGPAADIYALGSIFYELLTGRPPFLATTRLEALKQVIERDPLPPNRLQPRIPQDVNTICLKCLAKGPAQRYGTAAELADDLRRFLSDEPILARPVPWPERAAKWVRRRPALTALLGVVVVSLVTLTVGGVAYNLRIRRERDLARTSFERAETNLGLAMKAVDEMLSQVGEQQLAAEPRMEEKRRALLTRALTLYREFLSQKSDDPGVRFETAQAFRRMADVLRLLSEHGQSLDAYEHAIELLEQLSNESPRKASYRGQLAYCHNFLGEVLRATGRHSDAEAAYRAADRLLDRLSRELPDQAVWRRDRARALYSLGILYRESDRPADAEREFRSAIDLLSALAEQSPQDPVVGQHLARAFLNLGTVIRSPDRTRESEAAYNRAIALLESLSEKSPDEPEYRHELGAVYNNVGNLQSNARDFDRAKQAYERARSLFQRLVTDFPKVPLYQQELANTWNSIGTLELQLQRPQEAQRAWEQAAALFEGLASRYPDVVAYQGDLGMALGNLGLAAYSQTQLTEARDYLERAVERLEAVMRTSPGHAVYRDILRDNRQNLAEVLIISRDHAAAALAAKALVAIFPDSARDRYNAACFLARCASAADEDAGLAADPRRNLVQSYREASLEMLNEAARLGFDDPAKFRQDQEVIFKGLSSNPAYQTLAEKLLAGSAPQK